MPRPASIVIPTRNRQQYLAVALASLIPQAEKFNVDVLVVEDDRPSELKELVEKTGAPIQPAMPVLQELTAS